MKDSDLTISQAIERLREARSIEVARRTFAKWVESGQFRTAKKQPSALGDYWIVKQSEVDSFELPKQGRPPKPKGEKASGSDGKVIVTKKKGKK